MKFTIIRNYNYNDNSPDYICKGEDNKDYVIDIFVDGTIDRELTSEDLKGKTFECDYIHPCGYIAHNVKILDEVAK